MKTETAKQVFLLASHLLQYPDKWHLTLDDYRIAINSLTDKKAVQAFNDFVDAVEQTNFIQCCEDYVECFDFSSKTNLYLSHAIYGDHRQRGMALVELKQLYAREGLAINEQELPDYLPLMLEFAANAPIETARLALGPYRTSIDALQQQLAKKQNPHAHVLQAVVLALNASKIKPVKKGVYAS